MSASGPAKNARRVAVEALIRVDRDGAWSNLVLDRMLQESGLSPRDRAFAGRLFYGVLERLLTLDACVAAHCTTKLKKLTPALRAILHTGLYQLLYLDSVPDSAAISESVELAKALQPKSAGMVNAVLRSFLRADKQIPIPPKACRPAAWSIQYSCPEAVVALLLKAYGEADTLRILEDSLNTPPLFARVNTRKISQEALVKRLAEEGVTATADTLPGCLTLELNGPVGDLPAHREGLFHVQDRSSQLSALCLDAQPGHRVLDACAAPGGKSAVIAQTMENQGELIACDLYEQRTGLICSLASRLGLDCIQTRTADLTQMLEGEVFGSFDRVLCDVPCSGLGVMRRRPEIKYKPMEDISNLQYKILENSAQYCKADGLLIYSTCTLNPVENDAVAERFLQAHVNFEPEPLKYFPGKARHTILPDGGGDGFFLAAMRRVK